MLMSPDSSSSEVDPRPPPTLPCGPIHMIQVPECTQSTTKPQQIIHVDYPVKKVAIDMQPKVQQPVANFHAKTPMMKSDEDLNLGEEGWGEKNYYNSVLCQGGRWPWKKFSSAFCASVVWVWHTYTDELSQNFFMLVVVNLFLIYSHTAVLSSMSMSMKFPWSWKFFSLLSFFLRMTKIGFDAAFFDFSLFLP